MTRNKRVAGVRRRGSARRAFTLLEVLMVVAILGLLAAAIVPTIFGSREKAKRDLTMTLIEKVSAALDRYNLDMGDYPREDQGGLRALLEEPDQRSGPRRWAGPYVQAKDLKDMWGRELIYEYPGRVNRDRFDLSSPGPDGDAGTEDDVTNWERTD